VNVNNDHIQKVVYLIYCLGYGGTEKQLYLLLKSLDKKKYLPVIVSLSEDIIPYGDQLIREGFSVHTIKNKNLILKVFNLRKTIKNIKPDLIHSFGDPAGFFNLFLKDFPLKHIHSVRSYLTKKSLLTKMIRIIVLNSFSYVAYNSKGLEKHIKKLSFHRKRLFYTPNFVQLADNSFGNSNYFISDAIFIGRNHKVKNIRNFLKMLMVLDNMLIKGNQKIRFVIIGNIAEQIQRKVSNIKNIELVFTGITRETEIWISNTKLLVSTSYEESMSNAIMEAMCFGKPIVSTINKGSLELITDHYNGLLTKINDPYHMAENIFTLLNNRDLGNTLGNNNYQILKYLFNYDYTVSQIEAMYNFILKKN
jgi:GalNAc-alpha-(1->4)-GalNAc-alpha-(1->3)-diNAcBac-PP-undecaprenol alpha-1,4-N-acetyl-D-galactosaminyltransferase